MPFSFQANPEIGAEVFAVISGTFLSGTLMNLSTMTLPVLVSTSTDTNLLLQQWKAIHDAGHIQGPVLAVTTSAIYGYAAWRQTILGGSWVPFATAAAFSMGIVPYTLIFMEKLNQDLFRAAEQSGKEKKTAGDLEIKRLINYWGGLHVVRSLFPLAGAVVGILAMLKMVSF